MVRLLQDTMWSIVEMLPLIIKPKSLGDRCSFKDTKLEINNQNNSNWIEYFRSGK
jgi:hypothetical protein